MLADRAKASRFKPSALDRQRRWRVNPNLMPSWGADGLLPDGNGEAFRGAEIIKVVCRGDWVVDERGAGVAQQLERVAVHDLHVLLVVYRGVPSLAGAVCVLLPLAAGGARGADGVIRARVVITVPGKPLQP